MSQQPPASGTDVVVRVLRPGDLAVLDAVAADVFDHPVDRRWAAEFLADPRHHLAVALAEGTVVGMASGVHYVHPDKPPELWVNEVGVAPPFQNQGVGRRLLRALLARGREVGCIQAWVGTEVGNAAARRLYQAVGGVEDAEPFVLITFALDAAHGQRPTLADDEATMLGTWVHEQENALLRIQKTDGLWAYVLKREDVHLAFCLEESDGERRVVQETMEGDERNPLYAYRLAGDRLELSLLPGAAARFDLPEKLAILDDLAGTWHRVRIPNGA